VRAAFVKTSLHARATLRRTRSLASLQLRNAVPAAARGTFRKFKKTDFGYS
jgi:hypothetical protein